MHDRAQLSDGRELTAKEYSLVLWLLEHGLASNANTLVNQLDVARVYSVCRCGCASIDFAVDGAIPDYTSPMEIVSDFQWQDSLGNLYGAFVFSRNETLSGLDLWSIDGNAIPSTLPDVSILYPIDFRNK